MTASNMDMMTRSPLREEVSLRLLYARAIDAPSYSRDDT